MKRFLWGLATIAPLSAALAAPSQAWAQATQEVVIAEEDVVVVEEEPSVNTGAFSLAGGIDWTTAYFFRGYQQENAGLIFQPYFTLSTPIVENDDYTVSGYIGTWNSFHSKKTFQSGTGPSTWYESDLFGGIDVSFGDWTIGTVYTFYTYPNGAFNTIQEIGFRVGYNDAALTEEQIGFALKPYAAVYFETKDGNGTEDTYLELGIAPSWGLGDSDITLSVPVVLGMSLDDYYVDGDGDNEFFGYSSIGLFASMPLDGIPARYGSWTLTGGVQWLFLGADGLEAANNGDDNELIAKIGLGFSY